MQRYFDEHGVPILIGMEMASNETIKQAVMAGMGRRVHLAPHDRARARDEAAVLLDVQGLPVMREWFVVHLAAKCLPPTAQAFREFAEARPRDACAALGANDQAPGNGTTARPRG